MNTNLKVFLFSVLASIVPIGYSFVGIESLDGWGAIAQGIGTLFIIVVISLVFGITGFVLNKEKRFLYAFSWLGISLAVMIVLNLAASPFRNVIWDRSHPQLQNHSPCEPNYTGSYTCEEWQKTYQPSQKKNP
ncbi:MAG: DUF1634 domain-containing protein [Candidatus Zambryskibacteria bacterium]|nr:DUF1634 domain-containing protein [Candidatus Zambryskibacteria bacterium]